MDSAIEIKTLENGDFEVVYPAKPVEKTFYIRPVDRIKLRIKCRHLAEEIKVIKHELSKPELRHNHDFRSQIDEHLTTVVRPEVRATQLSLALMQGKKYRDVETVTKDQFFLMRWVLPRMASILARYSTIPLPKDNFSSFTSYEEWLAWRKHEFIKVAIDWIRADDK